VQNATVDQLYERVFERLGDEMSQHDNVGNLILHSPGMSLRVNFERDINIAVIVFIR